MAVASAAAFALRSHAMRPLLALAFVLSLAACGSKPRPATTPEAAATPVETEATSTSDDDESSDGAVQRSSDEDDAKADPCGGGE